MRVNLITKNNFGCNCAKKCIENNCNCSKDNKKSVITPKTIAIASAAAVAVGLAAIALSYKKNVQPFVDFTQDIK